MEHARREINRINQSTLIQLIEAIHGGREIDCILNEFSDAHSLVKYYIDQLETGTSIDLVKFKDAINALFNDVDFGFPKEEQRIFTIISLLLIFLKYQLNNEERQEHIIGRGKISIQKKYFEILSKYKREKRKHPTVKGAKKLAAYFVNLNFDTVKRVNTILGKNKRTDGGVNLAFFSRLLLEIVKANANNMSDNEIILRMYDFYRILYPEFKLLATEEDWQTASSSIAIGDNFRMYQLKSIKSITYYSNKTMFKHEEGEHTLVAIKNLLALIQKDDADIL